MLRRVEARRRRLLVPVLMAALIGAIPGLCAAADGSWTDKMEIHGFLSQAWATTDFTEGPFKDFRNGRPTDDEVALGIPEDGTFDYRNMALLFRYSITDKDIVVVQLGHEATGESPIEQFRDDIALDWAFYERRFTPSTRLKVGRVQVPFGIYNEIRDVGTVLPFFRPAFSIYLEGTFTSETVDGLAFSHTFGGSSDWTVDLDVYGGEWSGFENTQVNPEDYREAELEAIGAQLWLNSPWSGVRAGLGYQHKKVSGGQEGVFREVGEKQGFDDLVLSLETVFDRWVFRGEWRFFDPTIVSPAGTGNKIELLLSSWYYQFGWNFTEKIHAYAQYEVQRVNSESLDFVRDLQRSNRKDWGLALNYVHSANVVLKAEYHWVEVEGERPFPVFTPEGPRLDFEVLGADGGSYAILSVAVSF